MAKISEDEQGEWFELLYLDRGTVTTRRGPFSEQQIRGLFGIGDQSGVDVDAMIQSARQQFAKD